MRNIIFVKQADRGLLNLAQGVFFTSCALFKLTGKEHKCPTYRLLSSIPFSEAKCERCEFGKIAYNEV